MKSEIVKNEVIVTLTINERELAALKDFVGGVPSVHGERYGLSSEDWLDMYRTLKDTLTAVSIR